MRFSLVLFTSDRGIRPSRAAMAAEEHGFHAFYVPEHTHIPVKRETIHPATGDETLPDDRYMRTLDPWVALASAASVTSRIRLGTAVALPFEHDPITLAKTIATLDFLSGGRVVLGAGFGWNVEEMADHGVPAKKRKTVLREYLEAMGELWQNETAAYEGEFVSFGPSWAWPKTLQQPRVPVLLGARGTQANFRWIARSADGWITTPLEENVADLARQLGSVWQESGRAGRPEIVVLHPKPDQQMLDEWEAAGVTEVMMGLPDRSEDDVLAFIERRGNAYRSS
ncbi:MAG TPA: LLM class F420-dependent oxidoreductase [Acidimicrobiales bacterium]